MKKLFNIAVLIVVLVGLFGCEKDLKDYDGQEGVYFYVQWGPEWYDTTYWAAQPYTKIEFVKLGVKETQVKLRVMITGNTKEYDRTFRLVVDQDSTTAVLDENYTPFEEYQTLKKNSYYTDVFITVKNSSPLKDIERKLVVKLLPTDQLGLGIPVWNDLSGMLHNDANLDEFDGTRHTIVLNDFITRPQEWAGNQNEKYGDRENGLFGIFSRKKFDEILVEFPNLTYEDFQSSKTMPYAMQTVIANVMSAKLQKLYDANTPILEEDGRLMYFSGVSWSSYYGIPYVPAGE